MKEIIDFKIIKYHVNKIISGIKINHLKFFYIKIIVTLCFYDSNFFFSFFIRFYHIFWRMGICMSAEKSERNREKPKQNQIRSNIEGVDVVKVKLKHARDRIKNFINMKKKDI